MTRREAFGRLFPPSLFLFLGVLLLRVWYFDPVLIGLALCVAGSALSWLILAILHVAKRLPALPVALTHRAADGSAPSTSAEAG
jgi:hypothetical protein